MRTHLLPLTALAALGFLSGDCTKDDSNPVGSGGNNGSGSLTTGPTTDAGSMQIGPGGGSFLISKPGTEIDGMRINVPANSYADTRPFQVSYAKIQTHQLGQYFNPISPLITISNGGGYSDSLMTVRIPVKIPSGQFAMAFYYDPSTGELEGLPMLAHDSSSLTIITRHFSTSTLPASKGLARLMNAQDQGGSSSVVVSSVPPEVLVTGFDSGFRPGVDDWQFENLGSRLSPQGHCAGQSSAALWYFLEKKRNGSPSLWGRYDNDGNTPATPAIWEDDVLGYRFCSVLQSDEVWITFSNLLAGVFQFATVVDSWTFNMFSYTLLVSHKPALVLIFGSEGGHAMVCYSAGVQSLNIADPNYPGRSDRSIKFGLVEFDPYLSGPNAGDLGHAYNHIEYGGSSALVNFSKIAERWKEVENRTIGNSAFPAFTVKALDDSNKFVPLQDGYTQHKPSMNVSVEGSNFNPGSILYNEHQDKLLSYAPSFPAGKHRIGIAVYDDNSKWIGFHWASITIEGDTSLIPLTPGNTWTYRDINYQFDGTPLDSSIATVTVTKDSLMNGEKWYLLTETQDRTSTPGWITRRADGFYVLSPVGGSNPFIFADKFPAQAGDTFKSGAGGSITVEVVSTNAVKAVRVGTFDHCYEYKHLPPPGGRPRTSHEFFALGVGQIATAAYEPDGNGGQYLVSERQLTSYTIK